MFYRENGKIKFGKPEEKPAPEPTPVIAGSKAEPLGLLLDEQELPKGDAKIRILKGVVANGATHGPGAEITVPVDVAMLLRADGRAEILTLLPPKEEGPHPYRGMMTRKIVARMMGATGRGTSAVVDWIRSPLGSKYNPFVW